MYRTAAYDSHSEREVMARKSQAKSATLNLRVSPAFKKKLAEQASKQRRSVTNYLEATLLDLWEEQDKPTGQKKRKTN
jgi:predicted HicB family RNase H-like nuclease